MLLFSAVSFLVYAISCFFSTYMQAEFVRYGFGRHRIAIGGLQLLGATGLLLGLVVPIFGALGAAGLAAQMLAAVIVRIRIRDSVLQTIPALLYLFLNFWIAAEFLQQSNR